MSSSLLCFLEERNTRWPNKPAVRQATGPSVSYRNFFANAKSLSTLFPSASTVSVVLGNSIEHAVVFLAITAAGSAIAPLNSELSEREFEFFLARSPGGLVVGKQGHQVAEACARKLGLEIFSVNLAHDGLVKGDVVRKRDGGELSKPEKNTPSIPPNSTALILFTSGTTGTPKSVPLSHTNLTASIQNIIGTYSLSESDSTLAIMPLFHIHGLMASLFATLGSGGTVVFPRSGKFSPSTFFEDLTHSTWFTAVPTMHQIVLSTHTSSVRFPKLRFVRSCSAALAPVLLDKLEKLYGVEVLEAYAMTEAAHQMTSNPPGRRKAGTVGIPHGCVEIGIFDPNGNPASKGEICVKGANVTLGYLGGGTEGSQSNDAFFPNGFFRTGDEGFLDKDGFLTITGRLKELINRAGEKISPIEIDSLLLTHPDISEAVTFAVPDHKYGEVVGVAVIIKKGASLSKPQISEFVRANLAPFKVPAHIFIGTDMPRTATGKIQRRKVAEHFLRSSKL